MWQAIPKFFWWKIWIAKNDSIFNSKSKNPKLVASNAKAMLLEVLGKHLDLINLSAENKWMGLPQIEGA